MFCLYNIVYHLLSVQLLLSSSPGEATDPDYNGFVEGAFFSGRRAAKQMLARIHPGSFIDGLTIGTLVAAFLTLLGVGACAWHCRQRAAARAAVAAGEMTSAEAAGVDLAVEFGLDVPLDHMSDFESKRDRIEVCACTNRGVHE